MFRSFMSGLDSFMTVLLSERSLFSRRHKLNSLSLHPFETLGAICKGFRARQTLLSSGLAVCLANFSSFSRFRFYFFLFYCCSSSYVYFLCRISSSFWLRHNNIHSISLKAELPKSGFSAQLFHSYTILGSSACSVTSLAVS